MYNAIKDLLPFSQTPVLKSISAHRSYGKGQLGNLVLSCGFILCCSPRVGGQTLLTDSDPQPQLTHSFPPFQLLY